jgi:hypothetical protein
MPIGTGFSICVIEKGCQAVIQYTLHGLSKIPANDFTGIPSFTRRKSFLVVYDQQETHQFGQHSALIGWSIRNCFATIRPSSLGDCLPRPDVSGCQASSAQRSDAQVVVSAGMRYSVLVVALTSCLLPFPLPFPLWPLSSRASRTVRRSRSLRFSSRSPSTSWRTRRASPSPRLPLRMA